MALVPGCSDHLGKVYLQIKKGPKRTLVLSGGGGGNRTRVRKFSTLGSTCVA